MPIRIILVAAAVLLLGSTTAFASLVDEQRQGQSLVSELQSGAKSCGDLSTTDFEHVGEYVMGRALGSTAAHQAMNDRMRLMMGDQGEERMHQLMGQRFAGCLNGSATGNGAVMGPGMMGGYSGSGGWGAMMRSDDWSWMMGGDWRAMTRQDWQRLQQQWLGTASGTKAHDGWSTWAIVGVAIAGALLVALVTAAILRRPFRRPPAPAS